MALPINTRADALCALAVIEGVEDAALAQRLIGQLRLFLSAD
jgi:hypothetical protein